MCQEHPLVSSGTPIVQAAHFVSQHRIPYVGIVFNTYHADALRQRITGAIMDAMRDESCPAFYDANFANLLRKKRAKDTQEGKDGPTDKKPRKTKGTDDPEDKSSKKDPKGKDTKDGKGEAEGKKDAKGGKKDANDGKKADNKVDKKVGGKKPRNRAKLMELLGKLRSPKDKDGKTKGEDDDDGEELESDDDEDSNDDDEE